MILKSKKIIVKYLMTIIILFVAGTSTMLFNSCQEEDFGIQEELISNSKELHEYLSTGLELAKAYNDVAKRLKDVNLSELEEGIATNGRKYKKIYISNEVNQLSLKLKKQKEVLLVKYPSMERMDSYKRSEIIDNAILNSKHLNSNFTVIRNIASVSTNRLKFGNIEENYADESDIVAILSGYMAYEGIEVMAYVFEDGTAVYFTCDQNTNDFCYGYAPSAGGYYNGKKIVSVLHAHDTETGENYPSTYDDYAMNTYYTQYGITLGIIYGYEICYYYDY